MSEWIPTGINFQDMVHGEIRALNLGEKSLAVVRIDDRAFAVSARCPHASGDLCQGWLDSRNQLVCPVHCYRFDPRNGRNTSGEEYRLKTYPLEIREQELFIFL